MKWSRIVVVALSIGASGVAACKDADPYAANVPIGGSTGGLGGAAGAVAPQGGAGGGGSSDPYACEPIDPAQMPLLHAGALEVVATMGAQPSGIIGSCNFSSCHVPPRGKGGLKLMGVTNLTTEFVGKPSCEAPLIPLVAAGGGSAALKNSWLWIKLVAPVDGSSALIPDPAWGTAATTCGDTSPTQPFGQRMPKAGGSMLDEKRLAPVRKWICAGAPPP